VQSTAADDIDIKSYTPQASLMDCTSSLATIELASKWLTSCMSSHPSCNRQEKGIKMPARLIEVYNSNPISVRLRDTAEKQDH
jgi:hypothetical protein